ncbi:MGDG synthase family glycosyltransferase [Pseudalkalibacillus berkeleyi]|uniref:Galactosyldiacylglycerol synthase n=1 Tax=Pseudalkalibacillus berkeleyi TaxID=1069813 RepID=A0ABS9GY64_9BACL|nr:glycosyltransferase [Pseudalkalibacillus berkeleyi]MCF6136635.1 galactosyldiacylglycerol synthase [Pseudalkalibacillus berkeleyi]
MKKILFLPLFQMPSGHHQVADALIDSINSSEEEIECKKVDFLSYWNEKLEKTIGTVYLKWISSLPKTYHWVYKRFMYESRENQVPLQVDYVQLLGFEAKMLELIKEEQPDLIVCTHCFPSAILSRLKRQHQIDMPTVNVYTDFFINGVWGKEHIDLHLVNDELMKKDLVKNHGVSEHQVSITGIPTSEDIVSYTTKRLTDKKHILVAGGSSGVGNIIDYLKSIRPDSTYRYTVLCGKNEKLYKELSSWDVDHIEAKPYIESRAEMNRLYEQADAIITKPGGITISEALKKRLLIFVHSALPGQEQYNLKGLSEKQLIIPIEVGNFEGTIEHVLENEWRRKQIFQRMDEYLALTESCPKNEIVKLIDAPTMLNIQPG